MNICIVAFYSPYGDNPMTRLSDVLRIFEPLAEETLLITEGISRDVKLPDRVHIINIPYTSNSRMRLVRVFRQLTAQLAISWHLLKLRRRIDLVFWGISAHTLTIPMIMTRLLGKKGILYLAFKSSQVLTEKFGARGFFLPGIYRFLENAGYSLCHTIAANSIDVLKQPQLIKHKSKIYPVASPIRFIDASLFRITRPLHQRGKFIGFVGRLSEEKGLVNLIKAVPLVLDRQGDFKFSIIGEGPQYEELTALIEKSNLAGAVELIRWVPHDKLPEYLNEMQLMVLPSITEGLPTVAIEAMACGTPVLATAVGGVLELIKDGETGFILEDNTPQTIARGIERALSSPDLDNVVKQAHEFIEREYTLEAATDRFRKLLAGLIGT